MKNVFCIPDDGIGKEVVTEGVRILDHLVQASDGKASFESDFSYWGCEYYSENGRMMDADRLEKLKHDSVIFGFTPAS